MGKGSRLLILGLDGATWDLADRFIAEGRMPVLERLRREASFTRLRSTIPPMTLPAWTSILTGRQPGRHGIFDFTCRVPAQARLEFVNASWRGAPTLFQWLSGHGARVACLGVPGTWPPDELNGISLAGFDSPIATRAGAGFCSPVEVGHEIQREFGGFRFADFQELNIGPGWHERALRSLHREIGRKEAIARWILKRERWDAFMMVFGESDTVAHHFWLFFDERSPRFVEAARPLRDAIATIYERLDLMIGRLLEDARPELLCLVSDHGFGGAGEHVLYLNRFLEKNGFLVFSSERASSRAIEALRDAALDLLPPHLQEGLVRAMPGALLDRVESSSRWGGIDPVRSRAFSDELNYAASIHLNVSQAARDGLAREIEQALSQWEIEGSKVVRAVHRREDLYEGPFVERSPDLVIELNYPQGYSYNLLKSRHALPGQEWRRLEPSERLGGKGRGMNGSHRSEGLLLLHGAGVRPGALSGAAVADVAPTLLHLMGQSIPEGMDGLPLLDAVAHARPLLYGAEAAPSGLGKSERTDRVSAREIERRLRSLGYLGRG